MYKCMDKCTKTEDNTCCFQCEEFDICAYVCHNIKHGLTEDNIGDCENVFYTTDEK